MLNIKVEKGNAAIEANGTVVGTIAEFTVGARALAESLDEESKMIGKYFRQLFAGSDFFVAAFGTDEDREKAIEGFKKERAKRKENMKAEILKMAENTLVDNDEDEIGKKLVGKIKEMLEDSF